MTRNELPAFAYDGNHEALPAAAWDPILAPVTRLHWLMVGNLAVGMWCCNDGTVALFDESHGLRWLTAPDPSGTGISIIRESDGAQWGSEFRLRASEKPRRTFGPTWFEVEDALRGLTLRRTVLCPEGEVAWLLVHVELALAADAPGPRAFSHTEQWALRPRFLNLISPFESRRVAELRRLQAEGAVTYTVSQSPSSLTVMEVFGVPSTGGALIGPPATLALERLAGTPGIPSHRGLPHPTLEITTELTLRPGERRDLWFRFGRRDDKPVDDPALLERTSLAALVRRLPSAAAPGAPEAAREIPWHAAILTGGAAVCRVMPGTHTLNQASAYSYHMGFNGAARDPLQHALPLVYSQPDLALSVLRNTCAWAKPTGELPYALDAAKQPSTLARLFIPAGFRPSDGNLWALWLAAEYAAATGNLAAFDVPLAYHPSHNAPAVPLREHLRRQLRFFIGPTPNPEDCVGRGERRHVRMMNADWSDFAISEAQALGVPPAEMKLKGSSVLNSAMAAWVLGVFAALAGRLGEPAMAAEARTVAEELRRLVQDAWNGQWFARAYAPGGYVIGDTTMYLEVQPWAILCGAASRSQAESVLDTIAGGHAAHSPLGARIRWSPSGRDTANSIWYSLNMTLIWAAARVRPSLAWDWWRRMSLATHTATYPGIWEGTLSGPDAWLAPGDPREGRTWAYPEARPVVAMQAFPVNNLHCHSQPILAYLRLLGVEPTPTGALAIGKGAAFESQTIQIDAAGHGRLETQGPVTLETSHGPVRGGPGQVRW